jgi:hypothetical protein
MGHPGEGYRNQAYRYVVDEVMPDGRVCVRTLGWTSSTKGSLKELDSPRMGWSNPRYQEIPESQRAAELDRPTRWLLSDLTVALPEWTPTLATVRASPRPIQEIVKSQFAAAVAATAPLANDDDADFGALFEEESVCAEADEPRLDQPGALERADADEPQQATAPAVSTDRPETDTAEDDDDGWSI